MTPLQVELVDHEAQREEWLNYRVEVIGRGGELLTNPIYVLPTAGSPRADPKELAVRLGAAIRAGSQQLRSWVYMRVTIHQPQFLPVAGVSRQNRPIRSLLLLDTVQFKETRMAES